MNYRVEIILPFDVDEVDSEAEAIAYGEYLAQSVTYQGLPPDYFEVRIAKEKGQT